jgi:hypothetical protein
MRWRAEPCRRTRWRVTKDAGHRRNGTHPIRRRSQCVSEGARCIRFDEMLLWQRPRRIFNPCRRAIHHARTLDVGSRGTGMRREMPMNEYAYVTIWSDSTMDVCWWHDGPD